MILAATGHRPPKLGGYYTPNPVYDEVRSAICRYLTQLAPEHVICGMALGFDQWVAEVCIELHIPFVAAVPFRGFENRWPERSKELFYNLCDMAEQVHVVTDTDQYTAGILQRRNRWMVDRATHLLALWNESDGGTANCVRYAMQRGKPIIRVALSADTWRQANEIHEQLETRRARRLVVPPAPMPMAVPGPFVPTPAQEYMERLRQVHLLTTTDSTAIPNPPVVDVPAEPSLQVRTLALTREQLADLMAWNADEPVQVLPAAPPTPPPEKKKESVNLEALFKPGRIIDID